MSTAKDPLTKEVFEKKRNNQRFSCASNRVTYHNQKANELRKKVKEYNKPLHTNLRILNEIMGNIREAKFHKQYLLGKGFNFGVMTHLKQFENKTHRAIYNYVIVPIDDETIGIANTLNND